MNILWKMSIAVLLVLGLAGCFDDDDPFYGDTTPPPEDTPPPEEAKTEFSVFVKDLLASTSETTEPVPINDMEFEFTDDPTVYDDVLPDAGG